MSQARCKVAAIVAFAVKGRGIGRGGELPWRLKEDMKYFKEVTTKVSTPGKRNAVVMGRNTWASIPQRFRPLQDRLNVVLSRTPAETRRKLSVPLAVPILSSLQDAVEALNLESDIETVYVIGGASLYDEALKMGIDELHATLVEGDFADCDVFFPEIPSYLEEVSTSEPVSDANATFTVKVFSKSNESLNPANVSGSPTAASMPRPVAPPTSRVNPDHEEYQYLDLVREIIEKGVDRGDRTGTGTRSVFGRTMRFNLRDGTLPLLTTKRVFWRGVAEELLWFVSGDTSAKSLQEKNIHIWDGNGSREYLDKIGLTDREEGDLGPVYGFQWRHFGAEYKTMHDDYTGQGVDQLASLVEKLKTNPNDRRMIISAWNPAAFHLMALPPCHMFAQFYVANGELSCQMYQRSADMGLGVPFNIASYSLLTHMLAQCTGLKPGEFIHVIGDTHVYRNHIEPLKEQIDRIPTDFPKLVINTANTDIDGFKYSDFEVVGYYPQKSIKMEMSV